LKPDAREHYRDWGNAPDNVVVDGIYSRPAVAGSNSPRMIAAADAACTSATSAIGGSAVGGPLEGADQVQRRGSATATGTPAAALRERRSVVHTDGAVAPIGVRAAKRSE
jgi:hypothetical protein